MPSESRDSHVREVGVAGMLGVFLDEPEWSSGLFEPMVARQTAVGLGRGGAIGRGVLGTPRNVSGPGRIMFVAPFVGRENTPLAGSTRRGRGRQDSSVSPSWNPRTDITSVWRAYERRRARLLETEGRQADSPATAELSIGESSDPLEHDIYTPGPAVARKPCPLSIGKVPKILLDIINQTRVGESESLPPQKKLLNEIHAVQILVNNELRRLKRTRGAKEAECRKRVRTLMSMR